MEHVVADRRQVKFVVSQLYDTDDVIYGATNVQLCHASLTYNVWCKALSKGKTNFRDERISQGLNCLLARVRSSSLSLCDDRVSRCTNKEKRVTYSTGTPNTSIASMRVRTSSSPL